jgi:subtilisin-like proprotein convertase family protein
MFRVPKRVSLLALFLILFSASNFHAQSNSRIDSQRALFEDKVRFKQLSQAAQSLLQRKFGKKQVAKSSGQDFAQVILVSPDNVLVNNPSADTSTQDTQSTAAITLGSGNNVVAAFTDSGSFNGMNNHFTGYSTSADSGSSFTDHGTLPDPGEGDSGSPVLSRDAASGTVYLSTIGFLTGELIPVFRSNNDGVTFNAPVNATPGYTGTGDFLDKPWIAVDNALGPGQGNVYLAWRHFPFSGNGTIRFTRSTDGGSTWGPNLGTEVVQATTGTVQGPNVVVGPNHDVYVFWYDQITATRQIKVRRSTDQGGTFNSAVTITNLTTTGNNGNLSLNGGFTTNAFPQAAVNPQNNHLYVVYNDDVSGVDKANIFLRRSTDSGATWGPAILVNGDSTTTDQFHPAIAVTPDGSRVLVSWYDRRSDSANSKIERLGKIYSVDGSGNLNSIGEFLISTLSFPAVTGQDPEVVPGYMGEYDQATADNAFFYVPWGDNRYGNAFHAYQPDVRFAKVPVDGPASVLTFSSASVDDSAGNNNGNPDQDECFSINVTLRNQGNGTATGITSNLSSSTPGVTVIQPNSNYADIAAGAMGTNAQPFDVSTSPSFDCEGTDIIFVLTVTASGGIYQFPFVIRSGGLGSTSQFDVNGPIVIPDLDSVDIPVTVFGFNGTLGNVRASVQIQHTVDADLDLYLISPDDTIVELSTDNGGTSDNYGTSCSPQTSRTTFNDNAVNSITAPATVAPFAGSFKPEGKLADFRGKTGSAVNGTWFLRVTDDSGIDTGEVNCLSLFLEPVNCVAGTGGCLCPAITLTPLTLPDAITNQPYDQTINATGGAAPYTFAVSSGNLPSGLTLAPSGQLSGTPDTAGNFSFTVTATDANLCTGSQAYTIVVADCQFCDDFEDGILAATWTYLKKVWTESGGNLVGTPTRKKTTAVATPVFSGCTNCSVKAKMMNAGGNGNRISLLAWYLSNKTFVELLMREDINKWTLKQRKGGNVVAKANSQQTIDPNVVYDVEINYDGVDFEVLVDGVSIITLVPGAVVPNGTVGFQVQKTIGSFDEIIVN